MAPADAAPEDTPGTFAFSERLLAARQSALDLTQTAPETPETQAALLAYASLQVQADAHYVAAKSP